MALSPTAEGHPLTLTVSRAELPGNLPSNTATSPLGSVYMGETIQCFLQLVNISSAPVSGIAIKIELQTSTQRQPFYDSTTSPKGASLETIYPRAGFTDSVSHEIRETGAHVFVCTVHYLNTTSPTQPLQSIYFRKFVRFVVVNALTLRTRFESLGGDGQLVMVTQLQNQAIDEFTLDMVRLEPSPLFAAFGLEALEWEDARFNRILGKLENDSAPVNAEYKDGYVLGPNGFYQFSFLLKPIQSSLQYNPTPLGRLDIRWRAANGSSGKSQTAMLFKKDHHVDCVSVRVLRAGLLKARTQCDVRFEIKNNTDAGVKDVRLSFKTPAINAEPIMVLGPLQYTVGYLNPQEKSTVSAKIYALEGDKQILEGCTLEYSSATDIRQSCLHRFSLDFEEAPSPSHNSSPETFKNHASVVV